MKQSVLLSRQKSKFIEYFSKLPLQKLAAEFIGKDEDTITNWKKNDKQFSDRLAKAKSEWALGQVGKVRNPQWLLERIMREHFTEKTIVEYDVNENLEKALRRIDKILPTAGE